MMNISRQIAGWILPRKRALKPVAIVSRKAGVKSET